MQRLVLVGSGFSDITEYLRSHNYDYVILKDRTRTKVPDKRLKHRVICDFSSKESVLAAVDSIKKPIHGVMTVYENYILPTAWIARHLGLPGMDESAAMACTDKFLMRQAFAKASSRISPDFAVVRSEADARRFATSHNFPLILKPANLVKSLLVTKNDTLGELVANYRATTKVIDKIYQRYSPNRQPTIIIEEFLNGTMHSVAGFADANGTVHLVPQIVDLQIARDIGFKDNFLYSRILPSALPKNDQAALLECAQESMQALGMKSSPAHIEIILTNEGPRIVEIGARVGGYRERMHRLANNIDIVGASIAVALGRQPHITASKNDPCAVLELFPRVSGFFDGLSNEDRLRKLPSLHSLNIKAKAGDYVGKAADGYKMAAVAILHNSDKAQFNKDLTFVNRHVAVQTHP